MAYVLSLMPHSPLASPYQERRYESSWSSLGSNATVKHHRNRQHSAESLASAASLYATSWRSADHNIPIRSTSYSDILITRPSSYQRLSHRASPLLAIPSPPLLRDQSGEKETNPIIEDLPCNRERCTPVRRGSSPLGLVHEEDPCGGQDLDFADALSWHSTQEGVASTGGSLDAVSEHPITKAGKSGQPFQRWLSTLRRRKARHHVTAEDDFWSPASTFSVPENMILGETHCKSESWTSSIDFITAVKSASVTLASFGAGNLSRSGTRRSGRSRGWHGSTGSDTRKSIDTADPSFSSILNEAAQERSRKRREKLEELIRTEESYVADLKALINAYFTLLPPLMQQTSRTRTSARRNLASMIQLHDEILGDLHNVIPLSDFDSTAEAEKAAMVRPGHVRWLSDDGLSPRRSHKNFSHTGWSKRRSLDITTTLERSAIVLSCTPGTVSEVAKVFARNVSKFGAIPCCHSLTQDQMKRFTLYEDYAARCEMMQEDVDFFQKTTLSGLDYDKAIEALSAALNPINTKEANKRKALSVKDLLIKPIQRITRYELLFRDLCRYTPSCDDPTSHAVLDDVLYQLGEACHNVNEAKDNPQKLRVLENSWLLQDRLFFQDKVSRSLLFQRLGRLSLCGSLYVAYRTKDQFQGRYMVCMMYESCLILANAEAAGKYNVVIAASLATANIEETDNGKGLQCHTAPYTWKVVFESGEKMFEIIFAACSAAEESVWRDGLSGRIAVETRRLAEAHIVPLELCSPLTKDLRSVGKAYGKPGGFIRRMSVRRSATLGPLSELNQVIIKHTQAPKDESTNSSLSSLPIPRSRSVTTPSHIPTLAPMRQMRMKLEFILADVWTKDVIPFPGMGTRRVEYSIRDTANDLIRKLSMASIASNFSKRSMSYTGVGSAYQASSKATRVKGTRLDGPHHKRAPLIDFHNAPDAFLPADFVLQDPRSKPSRPLGLRTFTMSGCDRPRSPFFFSHDNRENGAPGMKRSKSVPQQLDIDTASSHRGVEDVDRVESRQSSRNTTYRPSIARSGGKKAKLLKFLGKVRTTDE